MTEDDKAAKDEGLFKRASAHAFYRVIQRLSADFGVLPCR